jgi:hypothetical protein
MIALLACKVNSVNPQRIPQLGSKFSMKRLLWSVSIACLLPMAIQMPGQATGKSAKAVEPSFSPLNNSVELNTPQTVDQFSVVEPSVAPTALATNDIANPLVTEQTNPLSTPVLDQPVAPMQIAKQPTSKKPGIKKQPAALKTATQQIQPVQAQNNGKISQSAGDLDRQLGDLNKQTFPVSVPGQGGFGVSPALSINNPVGFGADNGTGFISGSYQSRTRGGNVSDGEATIGVGLFDANEAVGLEISYSINSFGTNGSFGDGGFNAKLHKRFGDAGVAIGWNRFATIGSSAGSSDYPKNSYYAVATQVIRTTDDVDNFMSRIALSAGVGGGQFLSYDATSTTLNPSGVNVFGSAAFRVAKPVSAVVEWTGQDLAAGLSITPFGDGFPLVITPAFRDISGINGQSARFVLGVGTAFKF